MTNQKSNCIPGRAYARRDGSLSGPSRPADENDENVLASIARRHASRRRLLEADSQAEVSPVANPAEPPAAPEADPPVSNQAEPTKTDSEAVDLCEDHPGEVFYVRQALRKLQYEPTRDEVAGDKFARGKLARVLIVYLIAVTGLTVLAVVMYFLTL
ncbi:MAG: hypothetical protein SVV80_07520 [Planctomycetota bacterium]|nr:hypothetical protein [Planctomycetota bacterium]